MNRIDRYISSMFLAFFVGGILVFVTVFLAIDAMSTLVNYKGVAGESLIKYYLYYSPEIIYRMLPVASLLATILTLSNLNRSSELVALYAAGMSLFRVSLPIIIWIGLISIGGYIVSDQVLPVAAKQKNYVFYTELKKNPSLFSIVKTNKIWYRSKNTIFNLKTLSESTNKAQGLTLYYFNENWDLTQMITAEVADLLGSTWRLHQGSVTLFTADSSFPLTSQFEQKDIVMGEDAKDLSSTAKTSDMLSQGELSRFILKNKEAGLDTVRYEVDYYGKFGFALAALVMSLMGIPFSVGRNRSGGVMMNVGISLGLVLLYWIFYSSSITLGYHGHVLPWMAAFVPNLSMGALAWALMVRLRH